MTVVTWIALGLVAGFIGSKIINRTGEGFFLDIVLGIVGAVAAAAISDLPMYFVNVYASYQEGLGMLRQDGLMTLFFVGTLVLGFAIRHAFGLGLPFPGIPHI